MPRKESERREDMTQKEKEEGKRRQRREKTRGARFDK